MNSSEQPEPRYSRLPGVLSAKLGEDELALLGASQGKYYGLNATATRIWELLETPRTLRELCDLLVSEFDVDRAECERETSDLIAELTAEGLVAITT
jgi:hypothetical protein